MCRVWRSGLPAPAIVAVEAKIVAVEPEIAAVVTDFHPVIPDIPVVADKRSLGLGSNSGEEKGYCE